MKFGLTDIYTKLIALRRQPKLKTLPETIYSFYAILQAGPQKSSCDEIEMALFQENSSVKILFKKGLKLAV